MELLSQSLGVTRASDPPCSFAVVSKPPCCYDMAIQIRNGMGSQAATKTMAKSIFFREVQSRSSRASGSTPGAKSWAPLLP